MGLIPSGILDQQLTVLESVRTPNGAGGWTDEWSSKGSTRGAVIAYHRRSAKGGETLDGMQPTDAELADIYLDASVIDVQGRDRVETMDGRVYELVTIAKQGTLTMSTGRRVI